LNIEFLEGPVDHANKQEFGFEKEAAYSRSKGRRMKVNYESNTPTHSHITEHSIAQQIGGNLGTDNSHRIGGNIT